MEAAAPVEFLLERVKGPSSTMNETGDPARSADLRHVRARGDVARADRHHRRRVPRQRDDECRCRRRLGRHAHHDGPRQERVDELQRVASLCSADERDKIVSVVAQSLRLIVTRLARSADGRRTALRGIRCSMRRCATSCSGPTPSKPLALTQRAVGEKGISYRISIQWAPDRRPDHRASRGFSRRRRPMTA